MKEFSLVRSKIDWIILCNYSMYVCMSISISVSLPFTIKRKKEDVGNKTTENFNFSNKLNSNSVKCVLISIYRAIQFYSTAKYRWASPPTCCYLCNFLKQPCLFRSVEFAINFIHIFALASTCLHENLDLFFLFHFLKTQFPFLGILHCA